MTTTPFSSIGSVLDRGKLLVVLDLDKTLIHSELHDVGTPARCDVVISNDELRSMGFEPGLKENRVFLRPGLKQFIKKVGAVADVMIWTLSDPSLAMSVIRHFDESNVLRGIVGRDGTQHVSLNFHETKDFKKLSRTIINPAKIMPPKISAYLNQMSSVVNHSHFVKDLSMLGHDMSRILIVEDWPDLCVFNPDNAIIVNDFNNPHEDSNSAKDAELLEYVFPIVETLATKLASGQLSDVRPALAEYCRVRPTITKLFPSPQVYASLLAEHKKLCSAERTWVEKPKPRPIETDQDGSSHPAVQPSPNAALRSSPGASHFLSVNLSRTLNVCD